MVYELQKNGMKYLYQGCIDMETYNETGTIIPHGPGSRYKSTGHFQQGMFYKGELNGLGRTIHRQHAWHQGEYSNGRYHGAGACWRGSDQLRLRPVTTKDYLEIGTWNEFLREGVFDIITPQQEAWKAVFKYNDLKEITEDLSGTETFKKMKEVNDKFWSCSKNMNGYTGEGQLLLDYLDQTIKNQGIKGQTINDPNAIDLQHIKE